MGQEQIVHFLSNHPTLWYSAEEIASHTHTGVSTCRRCLNRLKKGNFLEYEFRFERNKMWFKKRVCYYRLSS